jgi:FlaA1/EpsC-like NDP-sugar epimerase
MGAEASAASDAFVKSYERQPNEVAGSLTDMRRLAVAASRIRAAVLFVLLDAMSVVGGYGLAEVTYFRDRAPNGYWLHFFEFLTVAVVVTIVCNKLFGLYGRMWRHAGADEARQLLLSVATTLCLLMAFWPAGRALHVKLVPPFVVVVGCMFAAAGMGIIRFQSRLFAWQRGSKRLGLRVAVIGSRDAGAAAVREMLRSPGAGLVPVAVFDDDPRDHGLSLLGVPVVGNIGEIPKAASRYTIQQVLLAIPSPSPDLVDRALRAAEQAGVSMKMLPGVKDMLNEPNHVAALRNAREPQIEDLLGRTPVPTDLESVRRSIEGHRVLVTGAGGSIGSEICRQVASLGPAQLVLLDHDETHLHDTAATINGPSDQALVDIFDRAAVFETFERYRPEVVFHAAAHKHVPVLEHHPLEAAKTNVLGTLNVVDAAAVVGTCRFVQISTDKAVHPSSVMGASKRLAEQTVLAHAPKGGAYCTVRFGNVLGSRGSVIPTFARQIAQGGPVTVTDPKMTRFFMSVEEAVQLVLQASVLSSGGEIFMLEMGVPVKIIDLAERMIRLSGCQVGIDIPIEITGMRPGEKLNEVLSTPDETIHGTSHPYINRLIPIRAPADVFAAQLEQLESATLRRDKDTVRILLFTAGLARGMVPKIPGMTEARVATAGQAPGETFEWPELAEAEAELELHGAATNYLGRPVSDIDQMRTGHQSRPVAEGSSLGR